ncbi:hypothetical protein KIH87_06805 [Paraneptunicella aestuarii]|uniref:hypothetical protein n=1 Tax=Paraneptunicella aestuarii TaxID=2831148 RepID=UPI001E5145CC|nr:hypothetical protein [Paraneptunicella aestuarii]UAA40054.1 hypothetical protein KIH87_06805 [Paraneptunicella aestuarii]
MQTAKLTTLTLKDAWGLATDRRFDNLNMPILQDSRHYGAKADKSSKMAKLVFLNTNVPRQAQSFADFLAGKPCSLSELSFADKMSLVLRYLASPVRYEPLNRPDVHYPVSSFGGLFSCGIKLIVRHEKENQSQSNNVDVYHYHANYHALEQVASNVNYGTELAAGECHIAIVGHYWAVARKYGEYSPYGVVLDAGIVLTQLQYLLALAGVAATTEKTDLQMLQSLLVESDSVQQTLAALSLSIDDEHNALAFLQQTQTHRVSIWSEPEGIHERFHNLQSLLDIFATPYEVCEAAHSKQTLSEQALAELPQDDVLDVLVRRSAANDATGFSQINKVLDAGFLTRFLSVLTGLKSRRETMPAESALQVKVAWINPYGPAIGMYDGAGELQYQPNQTEAFLDILRDCLYSDNQKYNLASMAFELFVTVDTAQLERDYGDAAIRLAHMAAGALGHDICLAASLFDAFARPVRMFRDTKLQQRLGLEGQLVVQVLVGFNRHHNFALKLL